MSTDSMAASPARVLVVDDEAPIRSAMVRALSLLGYQAEEAADGTAAVQRLQNAVFDLMLLDMQMPGLHGRLVMEQARQLQPGLLIIVLTGHATLDTAIAAVKSGAVDYLIKPASVYDIAQAITRNLQTRATQLRRQQLIDLLGETVDALRGTGPLPSTEALSTTGPNAGAETVQPPPANRLVQSGALVLDPDQRHLLVKAAPPRIVELTEGEVAILLPLLENPDQVFTCRQLVKAAWNYTMDELEAQSLVRPHIFRLRRKLEIDHEHPHYLRTVRSKGYVLVTM